MIIFLKVFIEIIECYRDNCTNLWGEYCTKEEDLNDVIFSLYAYVYNEMDDERIPYESDIFNFFPEDGNVYQLAAATYIMLLANLFDRINAQKGLFIYQPYYYSYVAVYDYNILCTKY